MTQHSGRTLRRPFPRFAPRPLVHALAACALLTLWPGTQAQTLPSGLRTASGQARVSTSGNTMTVTNTASAILNWQSFNIGAGSSVRFQQPNASSKVLNRVTGTDPSSIFGSLTSNGSVWLLNPNGVLFGKGARVDVGSLVASTLDLSDADWLAGRYGLTTGPGDKGAGVTNLGDLQTAFGGRIALLGDDVTNEGSIDASGGQVLLAAGKSIDLVDTGTPNLAVHVQAPAGQVLNLGTLIADGGRVDIQAAMVNQEGVVRANALSHGPAGEIVLTATQALTLAAGSVTEAEGTAGGGKVALDAGAGGTTLVSGKVSVASSAGTGGQVVALGQHVGLLDGSRVDASGAAGGGEILVGGGDRGQDVRYRDAEAVYMSPDAEVAADALQRGNGGHIVLWSNDATRAYGSFSARGGPGGGDGGHIETSGGWLDARPAFISTAAPAGKPGQWLLDPWNIEIVGGNDVVGFVDDGQNFTSVDPKGQASISQIGVGTIASALQTGNVTITTGIDPGSNGAGDITMTGVTMDFTKSVITAATPATLTLNAQRNITLSGATIESTVDGTLNVVLNAAQSGIGAVSLSDASAIIVPGGQVVLGGASQLAGPHGNQPSFLGAMGYSNNSSDFEQYGVSITGKSVIDTGSTGTIDINGSSISTLGQAGGVDIEGSTLTARTINIQGWVDSPAATAGVSVSGSTLGAWNQMTVTGTAQAGGNGADHAVSGTNIATSILVAGSEESDEAASLTIQGTATVDTLSTSQPRYGVSIDGGSSGTVAVFGKGHLSITGTVTSPGDDSLVQSVHYASAPTAFGIFGDDGSDVSIVGNGSRQVSIAGNILGSLDDHGGTILLQSGGTLGLANAGVESAGKIQLQGVKVSLGQATEVVSGYNDGTSILVSGPDKDEVTTFINSAGSDALTTVPGGRWLIYAATPDSASFQPDGLDNAFRQYNAPYQTTPAASGNGFLFKLAPTYTLDGPTKTYDGNTAITLTSDNVHVHGLVGGDLADLASSAASNFTATDPATAKNAGTDKPIDLPEGFVVQITDASGKPVYGYGVGPLTGTIEKKEVSVAITATDKTYDGKLDANVSYSLTGLVGPEQLAVSGDAAFANQNVQLDPQHQPAQQTVTAKNIAIADGNNGGLASNYTLDNSTASASAKITPKDLTVAITATDKTYDGKLDANVSYSLTGLVGPEQLAVSGDAAFASQNVQLDPQHQPAQQTVTAKNIAIADGNNGGLASNYTLDNSTASASAKITPKDLTVAITATDKTYDGKLDANVSYSLTGLVGPEQLAVSGDAAFANQNVQLDPQHQPAQQTVTAKNIAIADGNNGGLASNYTLDNNSASTNAKITPKDLTVAITATDKTYDGKLDANVSYSLTGLVGPEQLAVSGDATFANQNVQLDPQHQPAQQTVTAKNIAIADGNNGGLASNYTLDNNSASTNAKITPKDLTVAIGAAAKTYDGSLGANVSYSLDGLVGPEQLAVSGNATFASQNVQHDAQGNVLKQSVTAKNIVIADGANGGLASNYTLNNTSASASAAITPAKLTYVANDAIGVLGGTLPLLSGSVDGFVAGETLAGATTGTAAWSTTAGNATQPGRYPVAGSGLSASNYVFVQDAGNATALTLTPLTPNVDQATKSVATDLDQAPQPQTWPFVHIPGPVFDVVAVMPLGSTDQDASFASVPLDAMTPEAIAALLAARDAYKDRLFADAIAELQRNPALADTPACADLRQAQTGECLLTEQLKGEARAEYFARLTEQVPVGAGPQAAAATLGSATAATGTAAAAAPQAADAFSDYRVKHAALPQIERKVAVLIGVDSFDDTRIPALDNAVNDAQAMARLFTSELGYETKVLKNATKKEVIATLNALVGEVGPKDSVIVYYAGHGDLVPATGLGYWQLADANADQPETWLSNSDIGKLMAQFGATQVALISDSCYSGALVSDRKIRASGPNADASLLLSRKAVVVMSSGGNEPVFDSSAGGHSPFASSLMAALKKMPDWQAGGNVFESVQQAVSKQLPQHPQYGASIAAGHQDGADYLFEQRQLDGVN